MDLWIILSLIAPFFWGLSNIIDKLAIGSLTASYRSFAFFISVGNLIFFLICMAYSKPDELNLSQSALNLASGWLIFAQYYFYSLSLEKMDVDVVVPLHQTEPIFVLAISYFAFNATLSGHEILGIFLTVLGCFSLTANWNKRILSLANPYFPFILLSAALGALATLITSHLLAINDDTIYVAGLNYLGYSLGGCSLLLFKRCRIDILKDIRQFELKEYLVFGTTNVCDAAGYLVFTVALALAYSPSLVSAIVSIHPMYVLILTYLTVHLFKHNINAEVYASPAKKWVSTILVVAGVITITLFEGSR